MKSSKKMYALSALVAVFIIISFPSIRSVFENILGGDSVAQSSKPLSIITDKKSPEKPKDLQVEISKGVIVLKWDRSSDNVGVTGYRVYRGTLKDRVTFFATSSDPSFIDTQFEAYTKYYYQVSAYDAAGNESSKSKEVSIKSPDVVVASTTDPKVLYPVPMPVNSLQARGVSTSSLNLIWKRDYRQPRIPAYYKIYRNGLFVADVPHSEIAIGTGLDSYFHRETGLTPSTTYRYEVKTVSEFNYLSSSSTPIFVTTLSVPDTQFPSSVVASPLHNATVSGTTTITANAFDNIGVSGVQFTLNGVALGAEDTVAPYSYAWNTRSVTNTVHALRAIARDTAGNLTTSPIVNVTVSNSALDPAKKPWQNFDLSKWKIQVTAKNPGPTDYYLKTISTVEGDAINQWFKTDTDNGSMIMYLDATKPVNDGTWYRTELREVMGETQNSPNWSVHSGTSTLSSRIRIAPGLTYNGAQMTILQIHPYPSNPPLLRLVWYPTASGTRQLKVHYKTDAVGTTTPSAFCPNTDIDYNTFDADISVINGRLIVKAGRVGGGPMQTCLDYQIHPDWFPANYFKAGNYASQSWTGSGQVHFYKLETSHSEPGI